MRSPFLGTVVSLYSAMEACEVEDGFRRPSSGATKAIGGLGYDQAKLSTLLGMRDIADHPRTLRLSRRHWAAREDDITLAVALHDVDVHQLIGQCDVDPRIDVGHAVGLGLNRAVRSASADLRVRRHVAAGAGSNGPRHLLVRRS
jgi:hypothetical protein